MKIQNLLFTPWLQLVQLGHGMAQEFFFLWLTWPAPPLPRKRLARRRKPTPGRTNSINITGQLPEIIQQ